MMKKIILSDRGCLFADEILKYTDWEIQLLIVDDFGHHKEKYNANNRIKQIIKYSELMDWDGPFVLDQNDVESYLHLFNVGDYGARRTNDNFHYAHFQFYHSIAFWNNYLDSHNIDFCIVTNTLHGFENDYILEEVCRKRKIQCFNLFYHFIDKIGLFEINSGSLCKLKASDDSQIDISKVADYRSSFDYDVLRDIPFPRIARFVYKIWGAKGIRYAAFLLKREQNIHYNICTFSKYKFSLKRIKEVQKYVRSLYREVDCTKKYLIYFLHFEPEAVVTANSQVIDSQIVQIRMISEQLPSGWILYVKEHPDTYAKINSWEMEYFIPEMPTFYSEYFYDKISRFKNVVLVDYKLSAKDLITNCEGIATIAGTVMTEAIVQNKPVLMFAENRHVYSYNNDIFHIHSSEDIQRAIKKIRNGMTPDYSNIPTLVNEFLANSDECGKKRIIMSIDDLESNRVKNE